MIKVSIVGGSGYAGGELLRILLQHPKVKVQQITSQRLADLPVTLTHPNLRGLTSLIYSKLEGLRLCDLLFIALPNGASMALMKQFMTLSKKIIDLGADFRLHDKNTWEEWYKTPHQAPELLKQFVYGIPEIYGDKIKQSNYVAGPGCEAIVSILSLYPFIKNKLIENDKIIIDAKMGSSQSGNKQSASTHHAERSRATRVYKAVGHRHTAEIEQVLHEFDPQTKVEISATAIELVRGILVTIHVYLKKNILEKDIWKTLRQVYKNRPFIRIVKEKLGLYRLPEPKILQGTNFCEIGFEKETRNNRLVIIGAIDNLVKGTAGNAVQCMNLMYGYPETMGLEFPGLHPI